MNPLLAVLVVAPLMALFGYALQKFIFNRTLGDDILPLLLVSFGLSVIIQNALLQIYSADSQKLNAGPIEIASIKLTEGLNIGWMPLIMFGSAIIIIGALQFMFYSTALGRALRATSDDQEMAQLMGYNNKRLYSLAMAISLAIVAVAGIFLASRANFDPSIGPQRLIFGFEAVIIGGLGNLWGTLLGGIILGVAQAAGAMIDPGWQVLAGHIVFLIVLALRPEGLFPRVDG